MKVRDAEDLVIQARRAGKQVKPDDIPTTVLHKRLNCAIAIRYSFSKAKVESSLPLLVMLLTLHHD
jgi:hypothetical protein